MSGPTRKPYDDVGREPMTDAELDAAIAAWDADHPDQAAGSIRARCLRLNAEAKERAEAEAAGTTVAAMRQAKAERRARTREREAVADLSRARDHVERGRRGPRPMTTAEEVERVRAELEASPGESPGERSIAKRLGVSRDAVRYALGKDRRH